MTTKRERGKMFMQGFTKSRDEFTVVDVNDEDTQEWFHENLSERELLDLVQTSNYDLD